MFQLLKKNRSDSRHNRLHYSILMGRIRKYVLPLFLIVFSATLFYRDLVGADINKILLVFLTLACAVFVEYNSVVYLLYFLFPLSCGIPGNYIYPLLIIVLLCRYSKTGFGQLCFFGIVAILELMHYPFYCFDINIADVAGYLSVVFLVSYLIANRDKDIDNSKCVIFYCLGVCVLFVVIISNSMSIIGTGDMLEESVRLGAVKAYGEMDETRMMLSANANNIAYYSITSLSCLLLLFYKKKINILLFWGILAITVAGGILSVSRTWMISAALCFILYSLSQKGNFLKWALMMIAIIVGLTVVILNNDLLLGMIVDRFTGDSENLATAGDRTLLFREYNEYLLGHPLVLILGAGAVYYHDVTLCSNATHNSIQQIVVSYGLLGLAIFIRTFVIVCRRIFKGNRFIYWIPLICTVFFLQSIQLLNPFFLMQPLVAAFAILKMSAEEEKPVSI